LFLVSTSLLAGADFSNYRGFRFGTGVDSAVKQAGARPSDVKLIHKRPALIQEFEWRPTSVYQPGASESDSVRAGLLRFYNGELFQIVITYDRQKVDGMTESDMVTAISQTYGTASKPAVKIMYHSDYGQIAAVLARWEDAEYSYNLVRSGDQSSYALVLSSKRLDTLAQSAITESARLDLLEAPQRAADLRKIQEAEAQLLRDKARSANVRNFRP
jgi:hypothetical protein